MAAVAVPRARGKEEEKKIKADNCLISLEIISLCWIILFPEKFSRVSKSVRKFPLTVSEASPVVMIKGMRDISRQDNYFLWKTPFSISLGDENRRTAPLARNVVSSHKLDLVAGRHRRQKLFFCDVWVRILLFQWRTWTWVLCMVSWVRKKRRRECIDSASTSTRRASRTPDCTSTPRSQLCTTSVAYSPTRTSSRSDILPLLKEAHSGPKLCEELADFCSAFGQCK